MGWGARGRELWSLVRWLVAWQGQGAATSATRSVSSCELMQAGAPPCLEQWFTQPRSELERSSGMKKQLGSGAASVGEGKGLPVHSAIASITSCLFSVAGALGHILFPRRSLLPDRGALRARLLPEPP